MSTQEQLVLDSYSGIAMFSAFFLLFLSEDCRFIGSMMLFSVTGGDRNRTNKYRKAQRGLPVEKSIMQVADNLETVLLVLY